MSYERFTPDARYYSSQQQNPLEREARFIAQQMDSGNAELAGQRLREDLMRLQRSPEEAKQLVQLVEQFDRKGNGADLDIRIGRQNGFSVASASIVDYDYYRDSRTGRMQRQVYDRDTIAKILLDDNSGYTGVSRWNNRRGYDPSSFYHPRNFSNPGQFDPRMFDPRQGFENLQGMAPQFDPRNFDPRRFLENNGRFSPSQSSQFRPRFENSSFRPNYDPDYSQEDFEYYDSHNSPQAYTPNGGRIYNPRVAYQNQQEGYTGYRPDWQYNPEPSAIIRYQNPNGWAQQNYPQQDYEQPQNRNRSRNRQPHSHQHSHDNGPRNHNTRATASGDVHGLDNDAAYALSRAQQLASQDGVKIQVTSGFRTYAEQSRLYAELKGKSPVARPGTSAHESGEAIDVKNYAQAKPYLVAAGFVHGDGKGRIAGDPWHFRYMG